jgi:NAD(P)-dependent dehydrogenase (short-subunit alcohol dehydrogenase family)
MNEILRPSELEEEVAMDVDGVTAVVTGGASGLGAATVSALRDRGAKVFVLDLPGMRERVDERRATFVPCDVTEPGQVDAAIATAAEDGTLRVCVNCAGVGVAERTVGRNGSPATLDAFRTTIEINLIGTFDVIRQAAAAMSRAEPVGEERGVIVNTASVAAFDGQIGQAAYSASKGGIVGMTLPIARDLAVSRIRCVTIAPGLFDTPLLGLLPAEARQSLGAAVPHPARLGRPAEYAALVVHVVENPMLNGEVIRLDGAIRMAPK